MDFTTVPPSSASSLHNAPLSSTQLCSLVSALVDPARRLEVAHILAVYLGAEDLIMFIPDPELGVLLPAPGFLQTLPQGRRWKAFLTECVAAGQAVAQLPFPDTSTVRQAIGLAAAGPTVLVLLGARHLSPEVATVSVLLPLLNAALQREQVGLNAQAATETAQQSAEAARTLAATLDEARSELQHTLAEIEAIIEAMPDALFVCNAMGEIVRINANAAALLGIPHDQWQYPLEFADYVTLTFPDGSPVPASAFGLMQALQGITRTDYRFLLNRHGTESPIPLLVSAAPIANSAGDIIGAVAIATDITELASLERQKDAFLGVAAHELRTPLTTLKGMIQVTRRRIERMGTGDVHQFALMERAVVRMEHLITDLLDISRIEAGQFVLRLEWCDLAEICRAVCEEQEVISNRSIQMQLPDKPMNILVDSERISQVITNLLSNALKYTEVGTSITLELSYEAEQAIVSIRDQGEGIAPDALPHLFERFYQAPQTTIKSGSKLGLGLGLYICRVIVEQHDGTIGVESVPGKGATFWFSLPLISAPNYPS
jgi:PAS domain S-box-containing protein